jgi:EPS-associated MarR family transcriptional regulator
MTHHLFKMLQFLETNPLSSQRVLSTNLGLSLGKINYCMKMLIEKGLIKVDNFKNNNNKIQYSYFLTPKGIKEKGRLTLQFIKIKTQEYEDLREEINQLRIEADKLNEQ